MFYASLLLCGLLTGEPQCIQADDTRGPYKTKEQCEIRIGQMVSQVSVQVPWMKVQGWRCQQHKGV